MTTADRTCCATLSHYASHTKNQTNFHKNANTIVLFWNWCIEENKWRKHGTSQIKKYLTGFFVSLICSIRCIIEETNDKNSRVDGLAYLPPDIIKCNLLWCSTSKWLNVTHYTFTQPSHSLTTVKAQFKLTQNWIRYGMLITDIN